MSVDMFTVTERSMKEQTERNSYPESFPVLPDLPGLRYHDRQFADLEMRNLWKKTWLLAGLESDLPEQGSYFIFERLGMSVIVSRGKDHIVRAFHNSCTHRGSALLQESRGRTPRFVCPYHAWTFSLEGKLVAVPNSHDFACLDKAARGLVPVRCESWRGLIYINFDQAAASLEDFMRPALDHTAGFPLETLVTKDRIVYEMDCNWKLAYHNFLEVYHVRTVHPQSLTPYLDLPSWVLALLGNGHCRFASRKQKGSSIYQTEVATPEGDVRELFTEFLVAVSIFPNAFIALDPGGFALQTFWPAGENKSIMDVRLVGWEAGQDDADYWSVLRERVVTILSEDKHLFGSLQRSLESGAVNKIALGYQERAIYWVEEEIDRQIGRSNIPDAMKVPPLLSEKVGWVGTVPA